MGHHHILFDVTYTIRPLQTFQAHIGPLLQRSHLEKYIYYSNTRAAIDSQVVKIGKWIDKNGFKVDKLSVVSKQMRDQKFDHDSLSNCSLHSA
jgi:hypothetical protein